MNSIADQKTKPFDASEVKPCSVCKRGVLHDGNVMFYEVTIGSVVADLGGIRDISAMEMMLGPVGRALAPTSRIGHRMPVEHYLVCLECVAGGVDVAQLVESASTSAIEGARHG